MIKCKDNPQTSVFPVFSLSGLFPENFITIFFLFKQITFPENCNQFKSKIGKAVRKHRVWDHSSRTFLDKRITWETLRTHQPPCPHPRRFCLSSSTSQESAIKKKKTNSLGHCDQTGLKTTGPEQSRWFLELYQR